MFSWYSFQIFPQASRYYSCGSNYYWYNRTFQVPHSLYLCVLTSFPLLHSISIIIIIIIIITSFIMQGIYTHIPETNYVPRENSVAAILLLLFMVLISLVSVLNLLYFHISTFRSMCAVSNMAVFCSFLTSCLLLLCQVSFATSSLLILPLTPLLPCVVLLFALTSNMSQSPGIL